MIKNNKQLAQAKQSLKEILEQIQAIEASDDLGGRIQRASYECRIHDLEEEIEEYESLLDKKILCYTKEDLPKAIIALRLASGYTQKTLAEKLGLPEQQIQRYEQQEYAKVKFERIVQIIRVLASAAVVSFEVEKRALNPFRHLPQPASLEAARITLQKRKAIINWGTSA